MRMMLTDQEYTQILDFKRDLHMHPELSLQEFRTTEKIREALSAIPGVEILPFQAETGVVARICGKLPGPETMLRADIDALPQTEQYESPWKSTVPGVMHACGHDFHSAALIGAALMLSRANAEGNLKGTVDLLFQPAEEGTLGARLYIDSGLFDLFHPDRCFGLHNWPSLPAGRIVIHEGALMSAKRNFTVRIHGFGGHGSMPHLNVDPIVCAAAVIQSLQTVISRNMNPLDAAILSVNMIKGGSPVNLVVEEVELRATVRSLSEQALSRALERTETIIMKTAEAYECHAEIEWKERIPAVINTEEMCRLANIAAAQVVKNFCSVPEAAAQFMNYSCSEPEAAASQAINNSCSASEATAAQAINNSCSASEATAAQVINNFCSASEENSQHPVLKPRITDAPPSLASEDFALYRCEVPSFYYWVGSNVEGDAVEELHRPRFHTDDRAMAVAASLYAESALLP